MEIKWEDKKSNIDQLIEKIDSIHPDTDILVLPETFSTGFPIGKDKDYIRNLAERNTGETIEILKKLAKDHNIAITGSFIADSGGLLFNRAFFIEPSGDEYFADKRHLFSMGGEDRIFSRGRERLNVRFRGWNIALIVCYDLRFPAWCRNKDNSYDLLIAIANWPVARIDVWNKMLPVRAMENLAYVCGVDCKGIDLKGYQYDGSSMVVDFKGKDISVKVDNNDFLYASLSKSALDKFREKFPAWKDADEFIVKID